MNEMEFQRGKYIEGCSRIRVERRLGKITPNESGNLLIKLGRECQDYLMSEPEILVDMFRDIKQRTGVLLDDLGVL